MKDLIAALGFLADPNASAEDKAAALEKLTAYFDAQLSAEETQQTSEQSEQSEQSTEATTESTSEAGEGESELEKPSPEMASALAKIDALTERLAKLEKASAIGNAPRAAQPTRIPRAEPPVPTDPVARMIDEAVASSRRTATK